MGNEIEKGKDVMPLAEAVAQEAWARYDRYNPKQRIQKLIGTKSWYPDLSVVTAVLGVLGMITLERKFNVPGQLALLISVACLGAPLIKEIGQEALRNMKSRFKGK